MSYRTDNRTRRRWQDLSRADMSSLLADKAQPTERGTCYATSHAKQPMHDHVVLDSTMQVAAQQGYLYTCGFVAEGQDVEWQRLPSENHCFQYTMFDGNSTKARERTLHTYSSLEGKRLISLYPFR